MKTIWILLLLATASVASAQTEDDMVEFCGAMLIVARDLPAYEAWKIRYAPNVATMLKYQLLLQDAVESGRIRGSEILEGAANCKQARDEEMMNDE